MKDALALNTVLENINLDGNDLDIEGIKNCSDIYVKVKINGINKDRLSSLQLLCATKIKQLGQADKAKNVLSSFVYDCYFKN